MKTFQPFNHSTIQQIISQPLTRILDIRAELSYKILPSPDGGWLGRGDNFLKHLFTTHYSRLTNTQQMDCRENQRFSRNDDTVQPFNHSTVQRVKVYAFTLAETLIVIGIIGVVAALTLPNLNHATGDKETVTRLMKAYSMLNEANDRAIANYGTLSEWKSNEQCENNFSVCWMKRIGEFLKITKSCNEIDEDDDDNYSSCDSLRGGIDSYYNFMYQLPDGMVITNGSSFPNCDDNDAGLYRTDDFCINTFLIDVNGPNKGKNQVGQDIFAFTLSDSLGVLPQVNCWYEYQVIEDCMSAKDDLCSYWVINYGNMDYLKTDSDGKCNDNPSIVLDGVNNTSCH